MKGEEGPTVAKTFLSAEMKERLSESAGRSHAVGPFVTISRQYGCHGYRLGQSLAETLTEESGRSWSVYHKEILSKLATETNLAQEFIEREVASKPSVIADFFRSFATEHIPSGYEIRNRITTIIRGLALGGRAVILGQGGAGATQDLPNGLSVRLEAPEEWRIQQVMEEEGLDRVQAKEKIHQVEAQRDYLRHLYELRFPHRPAFHITYDCSRFTLSELASHIVAMMKLKGMLEG